MGDPMGQDACLPRARARHYEQWPALVDDGGPLLRVEALKEGVRSFCGHHTRVYGRAPTLSLTHDMSRIRNPSISRHDIV
jgi:hypothetical protein